MLMTGFRLPIINAVHSQNILRLPVQFCLGLVAHKALRRTDLADFVLEGVGEVAFTAHGASRDVSGLWTGVNL